MLIVWSTACIWQINRSRKSGNFMFTGQFLLLWFHQTFIFIPTFFWYHYKSVNLLFLWNTKKSQYRKGLWYYFRVVSIMIWFHSILVVTVDLFLGYDNFFFFCRTACRVLMVEEMKAVVDGNLRVAFRTAVYDILEDVQKVRQATTAAKPGIMINFMKNHWAKLNSGRSSFNKKFCLTLQLSGNWFILVERGSTGWCASRYPHPCCLMAQG